MKTWWTPLLVTTGILCGKRDRRHGEKILYIILSLHGKIPAKELIYTIGYCKLCRSLIAQSN